jgi:magnesium transporter
MLEYDEVTGELEMEQFSLIVGDNYLITFQERPGDNFNPIRERIRTAKGKVRGKDARYLAYLLLDVIVDNYIKASQDYSERIDRLENQVMTRTNETTLRRILSLRKELLDFKRTIDPLKEAINSIQKELDQDIAKYYRDLYDHLVSESENLAVYREMLSNLLDLHHSSLSYKMNNVMKVLTIITTIFVPLTFIVGVYGMNFDNMPELHWKYGYFEILAVMLALTLGMLYFFKKKRWL